MTNTKQTWGFRSLTIRSTWSPKGNVIDFDHPGILPILEDGWEPFQVISVGVDIVIFFKKQSYEN